MKKHRRTIISLLLLFAMIFGNVTPVVTTYAQETEEILENISAHEPAEDNVANGGENKNEELKLDKIELSNSNIEIVSDSSLEISWFQNGERLQTQILTLDENFNSSDIEMSIDFSVCVKDGFALEPGEIKIIIPRYLFKGAKGDKVEINYSKISFDNIKIGEVARGFSLEIEDEYIILINQQPISGRYSMEGTIGYDCEFINLSSEYDSIIFAQYLIGDSEETLSNQLIVNITNMKEVNVETPHKISTRQENEHLTDNLQTHEESNVLDLEIRDHLTSNRVSDSRRIEGLMLSPMFFHKVNEKDERLSGAKIQIRNSDGEVLPIVGVKDNINQIINKELDEFKFFSEIGSVNIHNVINKIEIPQLYNPCFNTDSNNNYINSMDYTTMSLGGESLNKNDIFLEESESSFVTDKDNVFLTLLYPSRIEKVKYIVYKYKATDSNKTHKLFACYQINGEEFTFEEIEAPEGYQKAEPIKKYIRKTIPLLFLYKTAGFDEEEMLNQFMGKFPGLEEQQFERIDEVKVENQNGPSDKLPGLQECVFAFKVDELSDIVVGDLLSEFFEVKDGEPIISEIKFNEVKMIDKPKPEQIDVEVSKNWCNHVGEEIIAPVDSIEVELYKDGEATGNRLTLGKDNNWAGKFTKLDLSPELGSTDYYRYNVKEVGENENSIQIDGKRFYVIYEGSMEDGISIINKEETPPTPPSRPEEPDRLTPEEPDRLTPEEPDKPTPDEPIIDGPIKKLPRTGNRLNANWHGVVLLALGLVTLFAGKNKRT